MDNGIVLSMSETSEILGISESMAEELAGDKITNPLTNDYGAKFYNSLDLLAYAFKNDIEIGREHKYLFPSDFSIVEAQQMLNAEENNIHKLLQGGYLDHIIINGEPGVSYASLKEFLHTHNSIWSVL